MQPPFDPAHGGALKRQFDESDPAPSPALSSPQMDDVTTAPTSAAPTPGPEAVDPAPPPKKLRVTLENKAAQGTLAAGGARDELQRRSDMFIRAHANVYLPLLGEKNHVKNLLKGFPAGTKFAEVYPYRKLAQPASIQGGTMKDYQLSGLSFMAYMWENGANCILADEMGLGKTLQTLSLLAYLNETHNIKGPHLLICPLSVLGAWVTEITRWLPSFKHIRFHGPMTERGRLKHIVMTEHPDLVVTTYEAYTAEAGWFKHRRWGVCVLDEGHKIKNHEAAVSQALHGIGAQMRLILSGTPLQNNLVELWAMLHFLAPTIFTPTTIRPFRESFNLTLGLYDQSFLRKSQALLEIIMLRRTKEGVRGELSVPRREEMTLYVPLSPAQKFWYRRLLTRADTVTLSEIFSSAPSSVKPAETDDIVAEGSATRETEGESQVREKISQQIAASKAGGESGNGWLKLMNLLMQLRKCCNHPYLLPNAESEPYEIAEHVVAASSKLLVLDKLLADILPKGEKVLIFSGFTRMLDILEDFMQLRGFKYARLDGSTSRPRRALDIKLFQQNNSPYQIYLISTRAGGLGINLTAASTVVLVDIQAISRAHRIGQTKVVKVFRLVAQDSVEEQALTRLRKKLYLSAKVMGGMQNATTVRTAEEEAAKADPAAAQKSEDDAPRMTRGELAGILRGGASALAKWGTDGVDPFIQFRDSTFTELMERGKLRDDTKEVGIKLGVGEKISDEERRALEAEEEEAERLLLAGKEAIQARKFEGAVHKSNSDIRKEWEGVQSQIRESNSRTVMIDGHAVLKETIACGSWEAVKTITSDPIMLKKLANAKKTKKKFGHEDFCMVCKDGGDVFQCASCPRSCHGPCSGYTPNELSAMMSWFCSQHNCTSCSRTTQEAGGLLFRCQTCPQSFCEDCLVGEIEPVGEFLPEFLVLGMGKRSQAYFIRCPECIEAFVSEPALLERFNEEQAEVAAKLKEMGMGI